MMNVAKSRIGFIHNSYLKRGGEDQVVEDEYRMLHDHKYNVKILKFKNPQNKVLQLIIYLISPFNIFSFFKCFFWLKRNKISIVHVHNWFFSASPSIFWAAKFRNVPVILTLHNYRLICPSGTLTNNGLPYYKSIKTSFSWHGVSDCIYRNSRFLTFILAFTLWINKLIGTWKIIDQYIVLTEHSKSVILNSHLSYLSNKLVVKPNFVNVENIDTKIKRENHFLFVGRLSDEKGIKLLMQVFSSSNYRLSIIGEGPLVNEVVKFAKEHSNVTYLGFKSKAVINKELQKCSALIFPSIWFETFGLIITEAFASATPVIASNIGSASILIKHNYNGLHFIPSNSKDLEHQLVTWTNFSEETKEKFRGQAYKSYLDYYTPGQNIKLLNAIYSDSLSAHE
jgi:glycosyltransferase involved in cell wall biosynthesis